MKTFSNRIMFVGLVWLYLTIGYPCDAQDPLPKISIDVHLNLEDTVQAWEISWRATGLDTKQTDYLLQIDDWGEWSRADSLFLRNLNSNVRLKKQSTSLNQFRLIPPTDWDGSIEVNYRIMMMKGDSSARENFGLMPWHKGNYGQGFSSNTLMDIFADGDAIPGKRKITFRTKPNEWITTGWANSSKGSHEIELDQSIDNTVVLFGTPPQATEVRVGQSRIEVIQFGEGKPFLDDMTDKVRTLFSSYSQSTGLFPQETKVIFTDTFGGGTNVNGAMVIGYDPANLDDSNLLLTTAHELFHDWLGNGFVKVNNPESVWFQEGFTDYLSLWHLAHCKLISRQQFVDRIVALNQSLENNPSKGKIAFGDDSVNWRDSNGPNEQMAYRGAALLAFVTDVELRKSGQPGLNQMISDLAKLGHSIGNDDIKRWYIENGLTDFHSAHIDKPDFVSIGPALESIGCNFVTHPVPVAYAGFKNDEVGTGGRVSGIDPNGAAAKAGLKVGDQIVGFAHPPKRELNIPPDRMPEFNYGLSLFGVEQIVEFEIVRDGKPMVFKIMPETRHDIASQKQYRASSQSDGKFFGHQ